VRVRGTGHERIHAKLWIGLAGASTIPTVTFSIEGVVVAETMPDRDGFIIVDAPAACTGWCDLYILFNSIFDWSSDATGTVELLAFDWAAP
jgi:hypothetical protein